MTGEPHREIEYSLFSARDLDETARLLGQVFADRDPPAVAAGISVDEFEAFVRLFLPKAIEDELTILARFSDTGKLAGVMLNEDCSAKIA